MKKKPTKPIGRPPKRNPLTAKLVVKFTESDRELLNTASKIANADDTSDWVRAVLLSAADALVKPKLHKPE